MPPNCSYFSSWINGVSNSQGLVFPENVGFPVGNGTNTVYTVLQVQYLNIASTTVSF